MPLKRASIERQLETANADLELRVSTLKARGVEEKAWKRDPKWRHFNAKCVQLRARLRAVEAVEDREKACAERKAGATADSE